MNIKNILKFAACVMCVILMLLSMSVTVFAEGTNSATTLDFVLSGIIILLIAVFMLALIFLAVIVIKTGKKSK